MKWKNVEPDIRKAPLEELPVELSFIDVIKICTQDTFPRILLHERVKKEVMSQISDSRIELGGLLLGQVYSTLDLRAGILAVEVTDSIPSDEFDATSVSLSMNSGVWKTAQSRCTEQIIVVGWYHSHPNLGAFFSGTDRRTQKNFFHHPYSLGLVIDPFRNEELWFLGGDSLQVPSDNVAMISSCLCSPESGVSLQQMEAKVESFKPLSSVKALLARGKSD